MAMGALGGKRKRRAATLMELLVYVAVFTAVVVATMSALGQAAMMRSRGKERAEMVAVAQEELDALRRAPRVALQAGAQSAKRPAGPYVLDLTRTLERRADGLWSAEVEVTRTTNEGMTPVRLTVFFAEAQP